MRARWVARIVIFCTRFLYLLLSSAARCSGRHGHRATVDGVPHSPAVVFVRKSCCFISFLIALAQDMKKTEVEHLDKMNELLVDRRVRPSVLLPLWEIAGFALGTSLRAAGSRGACFVTSSDSAGDH